MIYIKDIEGHVDVSKVNECYKKYTSQCSLTI